ncbi:Hypothetical protein NTJ_05477 [Nesidiocoris tenuis]|uniref:Uncharacterized protein n=1 Tax=Nesidiocoris tenuis TaxID=355587 RepID=A0ABN7AK89_9HEMI|nr:Hypothetical protein NTJ_05477 [Nesidiocoris tenuis]
MSGIVDCVPATSGQSVCGRTSAALRRKGDTSGATSDRRRPGDVTATAAASVATRKAGTAISISSRRLVVPVPR